MEPKIHGVPYAEEPWHEIIPGLFMGGHFRSDGSGALSPVVVADEFDVVVSMIALEGHGPPESVFHRVCHVPDGPLTAAEIATVLTMADVAADAIRAERRVLVAVQGGLQPLGPRRGPGPSPSRGTPWTTRSASSAPSRSHFALHNPFFVDYLTTGLAQIRDE